MAANSKIEWCDHTFNGWEGCQSVSPGCDHCYAEVRNARFNGAAVNWGPGAPRRRTSIANWRRPEAWNADHLAFLTQHGRRQRVFSASLSDVFDNAAPDEWRDDLFALIDRTPNLDWLVLTKRIGNVRPMLASLQRELPANVWLGATIVNQVEANRDIPKLLATPAAKRFLSMEPLLEQVNLTGLNALGEGFIDWVIVGGESGQDARPMHPDWVRSVRDQCAASDVPFLFKQWGEWRQLIDLHTAPGYLGDAKTRFTFDHSTSVCRVGKRWAGRVLDGVEHNGFPRSRSSA